MKRPTKGIFLGGLCLLMTLFAYQAHAQVPTIPHAFYGVVEVNGEPAPVGTQVEARGTGVLTGVDGNPITVTEVGEYGGPGGFDPKLVVQGTIEEGAPIEFYVNGVRAQCAEPGEAWQDSYPFGAGEVTELLLSTEGVNLYLPLVFGSHAVQESSRQGLTFKPQWVSGE